VPRIAGGVDAEGENFGFGRIGKVWFVISVAEPAALVAVMYARIVEPRSACWRT
jgi:hypothetical protein